MRVIYVVQQAIRAHCWPHSTLVSDVARHEFTLASLSLVCKNILAQSDREKNVKEMNTYKTSRVGMTPKLRGGGKRSGKGQQGYTRLHVYAALF